jgi:hypothetical protein
MPKSMYTVSPMPETFPGNFGACLCMRAKRFRGFNISASVDFGRMEFQSFLTLATRPFGVSVICHSSMSPTLRFKKIAIDSGMVARKDVDPGLAMLIFDLAFMVIQWFRSYLFLPMHWQRSLYTVSCIMRYGQNIWQHKC